jgi:hypothetical protein
VGSGGGGAPVRGCARERRIRWKRSAATSRQDHRAVIVRVLRPRAVWCVQAGAGNSDEGVAAGGGSEIHGARGGGQ